MAIVTDKEYYMDDQLKAKLDLCCDRCTSKAFDNLIIIDGDEGIGKSTFSMGCAYYVAHRTGRPFSVDNVFFDLNKLFAFARTTKEQVIVWDEAALGGMASEWRNEKQQILLKLLMVARKKRHFFFFNIPKFFKLNEYLIVDRSIALIHIYARGEIEQGRFCYFKKSSKERLYYDRIRSRMRNYKKFYDFHGSFPNVLAKVIDEEEYDKKKDEAILSIGVNEKVTAKERKYEELKIKILNSGWPIQELSRKLDIPDTTLYKWRERYKTAKETTSFDFGNSQNNYAMGETE